MFSKTVSLFLFSLVTINGECIPAYYGSGYCTKVNNNALCGYDGGDCCRSSCVYIDEKYRPCGSGGYNCRDPDEGGFEAFPHCRQGNAASFGTGYCTHSLNNADCGYDGGDCCEDSCISSDRNECGVDGPGFFCKDPDNGGTDPYPNCEKTEWIGTGYCTDVNNNADCGYDGGDCCEDSCVDGSRTCGSGGYDCKDPSFLEECTEILATYVESLPSSSTTVTTCLEKATPFAYYALDNMSLIYVIGYYEVRFEGRGIGKYPSSDVFYSEKEFLGLNDIYESVPNNSPSFYSLTLIGCDCSS